MARRVVLMVVLLGVWGCTSMDDLQRQKAQRLAHEIIILDAHMDVPYRLSRQMEDISVSAPGGNFDYPRARSGGLDAVFMAIYVPSGPMNKTGLRQRADTLIDMVEEIARNNPEKFAMARSPDDITHNFANGVISLLLGIENGAAIEDDITNIEHFYKRGVRYITLTHVKDNFICDSSFDTTRTWKGLSSFGREVVLEMNRLGCMIDVSHVSDDAFYQILELSRAPVIATHSCCRSFTPGLERNLSDDMIRKLAAGGGVVHLNFSSMFLLDKCWRQMHAERQAVTAWLEENNLDWESEERRTFQEKYRVSHPIIYGSITDFVDQLDHVVRVAGIDHVGFGSDFDGVDDILPAGMKDVSCYPEILYELFKRGYSESDVRKITSGNTFRVWRAIERVAETDG